jgi:copper chaperone
MTELSVQGMTCNHCVMAVKKALEGVAGVRAAEVDLTLGRARVEGAADLGALIAAVEEEGYRASAVGA